MAYSKLEIDLVFVEKTSHFQLMKGYIGGGMVSVLASSAVDGGFHPRSDQSKDYKIGFYFQLMKGYIVNVSYEICSILSHPRLTILKALLCEQYVSVGGAVVVMIGRKSLTNFIT
jgi:hypothetical protein